MHIDPPFLISVSALLGALMGGGASLAAAVYTQRSQHRVQEVAREIAKAHAGHEANAYRLAIAPAGGAAA